MIYYVIDTTLRPKQVIQLPTYPEIVKYLEGMSQRAYGQSRKQRMVILEELGNGYDDRESVNFVRSMAEAFNVGVVREGRLMRCDITATAVYQKEEYGS